MTYKRGDYNVISDESGHKFKRSQCRMTWDGYLVHKSEWYEKHPQLTIRARKEKISVANARTQAEDPPLLDTFDNDTDMI